MSKKFSRTRLKFPRRPNYRVLAIDPGYGRAGVAVLMRQKDSDTLLYSSCVITQSTTPFPERLATIMKEVSKLLATYKPQGMALERLYFTANQKTAMRVAEVRGALIALAGAKRLSVVEYTPLQVKVAVTGFGRSGKRELMSMIPRLVKLPDARKRLDDEYDAIAIGLTALASHRPA